MLIDRRTLLAGTAALALPAAAARAIGITVVRPERFGARGDGRTDDTAALQDCLRFAPTGAAVELRRGAVYRIDTNWHPTHASFGGLQLKDGQLLRLNGAELKALPSPHNQGSVIGARRVHGWRIEGPGRITGERDIHLGKGGEWGVGIAAWAARDWSIGAGVEVTNCWGDGIYVGYAREGGGDYCEDFLIDRVHIWDCRRCGIGLIAGRNGEIRAPHIHDIDGTGPAAGIDLEADVAGQWNRNIKISGGRIYRTQVAIDISSCNEDILVTGMSLEGENSGLIIGKPVRRLTITGNPIIKSTLGGGEGAAVRAAVAEFSRDVDSVRIENNDLFGGGGFVLDIVGDEYRDFVIHGNRIHASNRGVQGIARLGRVTFTGNECTIEASAGKEGDYFLYFGGSEHGGNVLRNRSRFRMHSVLVRDTDRGGDRYEGPNLGRMVEPR